MLFLGRRRRCSSRRRRDDRIGSRHVCAGDVVQLRKALCRRRHVSRDVRDPMPHQRSCSGFQWPLRMGQPRVSVISLGVVPRLLRLRVKGEDSDNGDEVVGGGLGIRGSREMHTDRPWPPPSLLLSLQVTLTDSGWLPAHRPSAALPVGKQRLHRNFCDFDLAARGDDVVVVIYCAGVTAQNQIQNEDGVQGKCVHVMTRVANTRCTSTDVDKKCSSQTCWAPYTGKATSSTPTMAHVCSHR